MLENGNNCVSIQFGICIDMDVYNITTFILYPSNAQQYTCNNQNTALHKQKKNAQNMKWKEGKKRAERIIWWIELIPFASFRVQFKSTYHSVVFIRRRAQNHGKCPNKCKTKIENETRNNEQNQKKGNRRNKHRIIQQRHCWKCVLRIEEKRTNQTFLFCWSFISRMQGRQRGYNHTIKGNGK